MVQQRTVYSIDETTNACYICAILLMVLLCKNSPKFAPRQADAAHIIIASSSDVSERKHADDSFLFFLSSYELRLGLLAVL